MWIAPSLVPFPPEVSVVTYLQPARRASIAAIFSLLGVAACSSEKAAPPPALPSAPPVAAAPAAPAAQPGTAALDLVPLPPDNAAADLKTFHLTMPAIEKWAKSQSVLNGVTTAHPELLAELQRSTQVKSVDQMVEMISKQPQLRAALDATHNNAHDYLITMIALQMSMEGYQKVAMGTPLPADIPPAFADNINFMKANMPAIQGVLGTIRNSAASVGKQ